MQIELTVKTLEDNAELKVKGPTILDILQNLPAYADFFKVGQTYRRIRFDVVTSEN